jgi:hypothetical protein
MCFVDIVVMIYAYFLLLFIMIVFFISKVREVCYLLVIDNGGFETYRR